MPSSKKNQANKNPNQTVEVLYQRLGGKWFAFSLIDDEVFVGSVPAEAIHAEPSQEEFMDSPTFRTKGHS